MNTITNKPSLGGRFEFIGGTKSVNRIGYGAMQLAGPQVYGPPKDEAAAIAVLREVIAMGIDHIDTSDYYGPYVTNRLIREALHPYADSLTIVTKVGNRRAEDKSWPPAMSADELESAVHDNLRNLKLDVLDVVNLRIQDDQRKTDASIAEPLAALVALKDKGLIRHLGISNVSAAQVAEARSITDIVCVQNHYNLAHREDDALIDSLAAQGVAYTPFFPLGGFSPLQSTTLDEVAASLKATPMQVALAWLLQRSPNILLIPGTSSIAHLKENVAAATLALPAEALEALNGIAGAGKAQH